MASDPQSTLASLQQNEYVNLLIVTAVGYDYILTFSREVEYIWNKPWTVVSTFFVLVRYFGLCAFIQNTSPCGDFLSARSCNCMAIGTLGTWAVFIFICAADFVMILRVWAMYHRSRLILGILLTSYVAEIIPSIIGCIIYSNPRNVPITVIQILDYSFCAIGFIPLGWNKASSITQLIHASVMCMLVIIRFIRQSLRMYKATKQWHLNEFINLFVMEGVLYFIFMLGWNIINTMYAWGGFAPVGWQIIFVGFIEAVPIATMAPRFVLNVRELYARNVRGSRRTIGIDSGFGLSAFTGHGASRSAMVFADSGRNEGLEHGEEISMEERQA